MKEDLNCKETIAPALFRSNSTSTILVNSTIINPNDKAVTKALATVIYFYLLDDFKSHKDKIINPKSLFYRFSEEKYAKLYRDKYDSKKFLELRSVPRIKDFVDFIEEIYNTLNISIECYIISLIYINRMTSTHQIAILPSNWRLLTLTALLLAHKANEDNYIPLERFLEVYPYITTKDLSSMESAFLKLIGYRLHVGLSQYVKYYLELESLLKSKQECLLPLTLFRMREIEERHNPIPPRQRRKFDPANPLCKLRSTSALSKVPKKGLNTRYIIN